MTVTAEERQAKLYDKYREAGIPIERDNGKSRFGLV